MVEDNWIAVDGETIWFEQPFTLIPEHENLWALHWKDSKGEYQFDDPPENIFFDETEYNKFVQPYVDQFDAEKARVEELERIRQKQEEDEYNRKYNVEQRMREQRDSLLAETDVYLLPDYPITEEKLDEILKYRQALRDITEQEGWPRNIVWPEKPEV